MKYVRWPGATAAGITLWAAGAALTAATAPATRPITFAQHIRSHISARLDQLQSDGDFAAAQRDLRITFDQVIAYTPPREAELFRDAAWALRLVTQLQDVPASRRGELLRYLRANDDLAKTLVFLIKSEEKPAEVYALLDRLRRERGEVLNRYATLAAAICVVHDRPLARQFNENRTRAPDPLAIFDYYAANEGRMCFQIRPVASELLIYVVDTTSSIDEMVWALSRYAGNPRIGDRFFEVKYDHEHVRTGRPKRITIEGFTLPNILSFGGVCADQAYFASAVGKALGIPTAVAIGSSGETGHSWVGFLQSNGRQAWWNFDAGRYEAYRGVRGNVLDPQTREIIPDSDVSLVAELVVTRPMDRQLATALADAAQRLMKLEKAGGEWTVAPVEATFSSSVLAEKRKPTLLCELQLLEAAVRRSPGDRACWAPIRELARSGKLKPADKRYWTDVLIRLCGQRYPDFLLEMVAPMIRTVEDVREQNRLWNMTFAMFQSRADLAAAARMEQARMWESVGQIDEAGLCYMDVINRYANAGPFVIDALQKAERGLRRTNRAEGVPGLYATAWGQMRRPKEMIGPFMAQSNWYRVGQMFAEKLDEAGQAQQAAMIRGELAGRGGTDRPVGQ